MIEIRHLTKRYGSHTAVSDLSLTVEPGKIYGFLGPNGAGKSTTMNMMTGCLSATEGSVLIDGHDIFEEPDKAKALIGYLPELPPVYPDMTPREYLTFVARATPLIPKTFWRMSMAKSGCSSSAKMRRILSIWHWRCWKRNNSSEKTQTQRSAVSFAALLFELEKEIHQLCWRKAGLYCGSGFKRGDEKKRKFTK